MDKMIVFDMLLYLSIGFKVFVILTNLVKVVDDSSLV